MTSCGCIYERDVIDGIREEVAAAAGAETRKQIFGNDRGYFGMGFDVFR
jgi:hypothetical protein